MKSIIVEIRVNLDDAKKFLDEQNAKSNEGRGLLELFGRSRSTLFIV